VTDQRERVSTDPGIGPVDADNTATLRSIEAAVEIEPDGASLYYEPLPLRAVSDHRTLEMETVKLAQEIDPRKLQTELSLPRSPVPPRYDSGWPQADLVLTSSQRPAPPRRRWRLPVLLLGVLVALLTLVLARSAAQRTTEQNAASALRTEVVALPAPAPQPVPVAPVASVPPVAASAAASAAPTSSAVSAPTSSAVSAPTSSAVSAPSTSAVSRASAPVLAAPHHAAPKLSAAPSASNPAPSAPTAKPKRAIY
jgi:hypothetical protein